MTCMESFCRSYLKRHSVLELRTQFNNALRRIQIEKNVHITCLPFDVRLHIAHQIVSEKVLNLPLPLHRSNTDARFAPIACALGSDVVEQLKSHARMRTAKETRLLAICNDLAKSFVRTALQTTCVILLHSQRTTPRDCATDNGHQIAYIEGNLDKHSVVHFTCSKQECRFTLSVHEAMLVKYSREASPFEGLDSISINLNGDKRRIWWVSPEKHAEMTVCL